MKIYVNRVPMNYKTWRMHEGRLQRLVAVNFDTYTRSAQPVYLAPLSVSRFAKMILVEIGSDRPLFFIAFLSEWPFILAGKQKNMGLTLIRSEKEEEEEEQGAA